MIAEEKQEQQHDEAVHIELAEPALGVHVVSGQRLDRAFVLRRERPLLAALHGLPLADAAAPKRRCRSASLRFGVGLPLPTVTPGRAGAPFVGWGLPGAPVVSGEPAVVALRRRNTWPAYRDEGHGLPA